MKGADMLLSDFLNKNPTFNVCDLNFLKRDGVVDAKELKKLHLSLRTPDFEETEQPFNLNAV